MSRCRRAWNETLDEAGRDGWRSYGLSHHWYDRCGQQRTLRGIEWFCAVNVRRLRAGLELILTVPTVGYGLWMYPSSVAFVGASTIEVDWSERPPSPWRLVLLGTGPVSAGTERFPLEASWYSYAAPSHVVWLVALDPLTEPPVEVLLPWVFSGGERLDVTGCFVHEWFLYDTTGIWEWMWAVYEP